MQSAVLLRQLQLTTPITLTVQLFVNLVPPIVEELPFGQSNQLTRRHVDTRRYKSILEQMLLVEQGSLLQYGCTDLCLYSVPLNLKTCLHKSLVKDQHSLYFQSL